MKLKNIPPVPAVLLAIVSVQGGAAIAKGIFPSMGATGTATLRIVLSAVMLSIAYRPKLNEISRKRWKFIIPYGITLGAMNLSFYLSLSRIPLGLAVTLEFLGPLVLAISSSRKALDFLWALLAAVGIFLIAPWSVDSKLDLLGTALALLAGTFWAAYILIGGKVSKVIDGGQAVSIGMAVASCVVIPFAVSDGSLAQLNFELFGLGLAIALLSSAIPYTLEMSALKHIPAKTFSILMSLEPAVAAICGIIFLSEHLSAKEWISIFLVVIASLGATLVKSKTSDLAAEKS
jgi:inner membrane transporter RhtA